MSTKGGSRECDLCGKQFTLAHRGKKSKYCSAYCETRSGAVRRYGLTNHEYREMVRDRRCNLCGRKMTLRQFNVEHDHKTQEVYGAVCSACNHMLALIRRSALTAFRTLEYLTIPPARALRGEPILLTDGLIEKLSKQKPRYRRFRK